MNSNFLKALLKHIESLNKINFDEYITDDVDTELLNLYLDNDCSLEELETMHLEITGRPVTYKIELRCIEGDELEFENCQTIELINFTDAYGSCHFKFEGQEYYSISNYDSGSSIKEHLLPEGYKVLTDYLFFSVADNKFYVFHVGYKDQQYKIFNTQESDGKIDVLQLIADGMLCGKRAFYWNVADHNINLRCHHDILKSLGETSPSEYSENISGTRLRINMI